MTLQPLIQRQAPQGIIHPYGWLGKILKIPVFRLALGDDLISRIFIGVYNIFSGIGRKQGGSSRNFDPAIAQRSLDRFVALGAESHFVVPRDGRGKTHMMTFRAEDLERKIQELGGVWERRIVQGCAVFAIVPPEQQGPEWVDFQEKLKHFRWREEEGVIITCDCADAIPPDSITRCFLYAHSTSSSFTSDWQRAGFYLGAKQDFCFFNNGNTWKNSGRPPSEESFYLEIEAVYNKIKDQYPIDCLWVGGKCGGAPVAAYLKRLFHQDGIHFFCEQGFSDLDDFVKPISTFFAPRVKGCLNDQVLPADMENPPPACQFGIAKLWEHLPRNEDRRNGKIILVQVRDDEHIGPDASARYLEVAHKVNANVHHLLYSSKIRWRHSDDFFGYKDPRREFMAAVFN